MALLDLFRRGLSRTRAGLGQKLGYLFRSRGSEREFFDGLEEALVTSDVGVEATQAIVEGFRGIVKERALFGGDAMQPAFAQYLTGLLTVAPLFPSNTGLRVALLLGVNGAGKTTTAAKLAHHFKKNGDSVLLAAADTFRAAAVEQLVHWAERVGVPVVRQQAGADPGAVVFDALDAARARKADVVLIDTAGRFHNRANLVKELAKIDKIAAGKLTADDCYRRVIVLDATAGSNAYQQAASFKESVAVDGVILTKLDSSAKGGVALAVARGLGLPILYVGLGEGLDDLVPFDPAAFVESLLADPE